MNSKLCTRIGSLLAQFGWHILLRHWYDKFLLTTKHFMLLEVDLQYKTEKILLSSVKENSQLSDDLRTRLNIYSDFFCELQGVRLGGRVLESVRHKTGRRQESNLKLRQ